METMDSDDFLSVHHILASHTAGTANFGTIIRVQLNKSREVC